METEKINRLKIVLVEQGKTGKWLADSWERTKLLFPGGVPIQANLIEMLMKIAAILNVDARRLINNGIEE